MATPPRILSRRIWGASFAAVLAFFARPSPAAESSQVYEFDAGPRADAGIAISRFRLRLPGSAHSPRGIMVLLGGRNSDARDKADQSDWTNFAEKSRLALLGCFLKGIGGDHSTYQLDEDGATARHLNTAIAAMAKMAGRPELAGAPLAFWGASAGGNVSVAYAWHFPERALGIVTIVAPNGHGPPTAQKIKIPILAVIGGKDRPEWLSYALECYGCVRGKPVPWTLAMHPLRGHSGDGADRLTFAFFNAIINRRIATDRGKGAPLMELDIAGDWVGDLISYEIAPCGQFRGDRKNVTWLPDRATAEAWRSYLRSP